MYYYKFKTVRKSFDGKCVVSKQNGNGYRFKWEFHFVPSNNAIVVDTIPSPKKPNSECSFRQTAQVLQILQPAFASGSSRD